MKNHVAAVLSLFLVGLFTSGTMSAEVREVVILYTNDFHSAIDPIPAYWMEGDPPPRLGGAAQLMTLVERIRREEAAKGNHIAVVVMDYFRSDEGPVPPPAMGRLIAVESSEE